MLCYMFTFGLLGAVSMSVTVLIHVNDQWYKEYHHLNLLKNNW